MIVSCDPKGISHAVNIVKKGGIIVFPTDTVYGIGCNPHNPIGVDRIYKIKNRDPKKLLPVLGYSKKELERIAFFDKISKKIIEKFWPGPLTLILKLKDKGLKKSMKLSTKIAVRIPDNECALSILKNCGILIGTSANVSGSLSFRDPKECRKNLKDYDIFVDGGKIMGKGESTIIEIENSEIKILREGAITKKEVFQII